MRVTVVRTNRLHDQAVTIYRPNQDRFSPHYGERRVHLVISAPSGMRDAAIVAALGDRLGDSDLQEVAAALGLPEPHSYPPEPGPGRSRGPGG